MKKLVYSALALTLVSVPTFAADNGWSGLDKAIDGLASSLAADKGAGPKLSGWVISSYRHSKNNDATKDVAAVPNDPATMADETVLASGTGTQTQSGVQLDSARLIVTGDAGNDFSYKVSFDFSSTPKDAGGDGTGALHGGKTTAAGVLKDAWAKFKIIDQLNGQIGRFKEPLLRSAIVSDNRLLFLDRTITGESLGRRDLGVQLTGSFDVVDFWVAAQDGNDGQADEHRYTVRVTADIIGNGTGDGVEGAYGAGDETNLTVGVAVQDETALDKGLIVAGEVTMTIGAFSFQAEIVDVDKGDDNNGDGDYTDSGEGFHLNNALGHAIGDTTPWDVTASFLINENWEVAGRYEDLDDKGTGTGKNSTAWTLGLNHYVQGHDIKWQAQFKTINQTGQDITQFGLGLAVSF